MSLAYHDASAERNPLENGISLATLNRALAIGEHALSLYIHMATIANGEGRCWPTIDTLCDLSDLSKNTVKKYIDLLEQRGLIAIVQKGQWRGLPTVYELEPTVVYPNNIVNLFTEKGSNTAPIVNDFTEKGSNTTIDPWIAEGLDDEKGSIASQWMNVQGVNDTKERGQRHQEKGVNPPPHPPSSSNRELTTPTTAPTVEYRTAQWLWQTPGVQAFARKHELTFALVARQVASCNATVWEKDPPTGPQNAANRFLGWLRKGENSGIHKQWRREDPVGMAGLNPR